MEVEEAKVVVEVVVKVVEVMEVKVVVEVVVEVEQAEME